MLLEFLMKYHAWVDAGARVWRDLIEHDFKRWRYAL